ncbi:MerR family transcriptional regulator [Streptomyces sp. B1866]|uniref:MerR family transcriptional regulator n=1 Tax=Streptomyces sp. B1866 TaxID=3075431 RepID=UPI00288FCADC|nr:MerR family transcriptional regulator [Streptomyces sp. B1866]MDT3396705.1 MerR family transcriptional regulator [Streptomyces sp. B1866]
MKSSEDLSIGELAARFGLATHVLRHWEDVGLLAPPRRGNGRRRYGRQDLARVAVILLGKEAGLSLEQMRLLLDGPADRDARRALYREHCDELRRRIAGAQASLALVEHAMECGADDFTRCPDFQAKVAARVPDRSAGVRGGPGAGAAGAGGSVGAGAGAAGAARGR